MQPKLREIFRSHHKVSDLPVWLLIALLRSLALLPLPVLYSIGWILGSLIYYLVPSRRGIALRNLTACFPDMGKQQSEKLALAHFRYLIFGVLALGVAWWGSAKRLERLISTKNSEEYESLIEQGTGVILLAPHFAALEYGGMYLSSKRKVTSMYQRNKNPLLDVLIKDHRARFDAIQYGSKEPIKGMIKHIREGLPLYYLPDQDPGKKGVFAPFFNIPAATFPTLGRLARMGRAKVVPICTRILPWGRGFEIVFLPTIENFPVGEEVADTTAMNHAIEKLIAEAPAQYFWSHKRFKTRPEGESRFYS